MKTVADPAYDTVDFFLAALDIFYANGVNANIVFFDNKPSSKEPWTKEVWFCHYRTNIPHALKKNPLKLSDLQVFIACYKVCTRHNRKQTHDAVANPEGRGRKFNYEEIIARDKTSLDITWFKDKCLDDLANLPAPDVLPKEIAENLESALGSFREIMVQLNKLYIYNN